MRNIKSWTNIKIDRLRLSLNSYPFRDYAIDRRCIFIHIPKNAGTSILNFLSPNQRVPRDHAAWGEFQQRSPKLFHRYYKFCVVREPVDRYLSAFSYLQQGGNGSDEDTLLQGLIKSFDGDPSRFALHIMSDCNFLKSKLFIPQWRYVCNYNLAIMVDDVLRFENLAKDFNLVKERLRIDATLTTLNGSGEKKVTRNSLSNEALSKLYDVYRHDFDVFHY